MWSASLVGGLLLGSGIWSCTWLASITVHLAGDGSHEFLRRDDGLKNGHDIAPIGAGEAIADARDRDAEDLHQRDQDVSVSPGPQLAPSNPCAPKKSN